MRGEHTITSVLSRSTLGSSPRARGARVDKDKAVIMWGIIPACAGSTRPDHPGHGQAGDHPRVRGEHPGLTPYTRNSEGSSPRARGALGGCDAFAEGLGIIPACAGSTIS